VFIFSLFASTFVLCNKRFICLFGFGEVVGRINEVNQRLVGGVA